MENIDGFMIRTIKYDRFQNRIVTVITNRNLGQELRDEHAKRGAANLPEKITPLHGENEFTVSVMIESKKGIQFNIEKFDFDGNQIELVM